MEVPLTAFGALRPLFRYRSIPPLCFCTDKDVSDVNQKRVRIANSKPKNVQGRTFLGAAPITNLKTGIPHYKNASKLFSLFSHY